MQIAFARRSVLVSGAVRGIGRSIALGFAERGATVYAADILADELEAAVAASPISGDGRLLARPLDVTDSSAVATLVAEIERASETDAVDVVVHAAGGVRGQQARPVEEVSDAAWQEILQVNVTGAFSLARAVTPGMKGAGRGRIVVISSRAGLGVSLTGIQSYATAKAAQLGLVRQLSHELGPHGITVNAVAPGFMRTSPDYERQWQSYGEAGQRALIERTAMRRLGRPEDIAHAVMFLASDYAGWITGQTLPVSGGP